MTDRSWQPDAGDLIWTELSLTNGGRHNGGASNGGSRPALVVSAKEFTVNTGLAIVCPIVSRARPFPTSVILPPGLPISGEVLVSHVRSIDIAARPVRYAGAAVDASVAEDVRARLAAILDI
jgi:mRNA interferase MazF